MLLHVGYLSNYIHSHLAEVGEEIGGEYHKAIAAFAVHVHQTETHASTVRDAVAYLGGQGYSVHEAATGAPVVPYFGAPPAPGAENEAGKAPSEPASGSEAVSGDTPSEKLPETPETASHGELLAGMARPAND
jgi:hypothetical protein